MYYSDNPAHVRVDFFNPSGKWKYTEMIDMTGFYHGLTVELVKNAILKMLNGRHKGLWAVCLDPYVESPFPVMFVVPD